MRGIRDLVALSPPLVVTHAELDRIAYAARTPGGRLLLGGGGNAAYSYRYGGVPVASARSEARAVPFMRGVLARYFPGAAHAKVEYAWAGTLGLTLDRVCSMGVRGEHRNLFYALGYSGHGVALGLLAGRVLADLYEGNHEAWRDQPFYQKRLTPFPPEPLRWLGYQAWTRLTGKSPRRRACAAARCGACTRPAAGTRRASSSRCRGRRARWRCGRPA